MFPVAAQCRNILLWAIRDAIHLAVNTASKLEANPRDPKTVSIFLKLFGHDPSRRVPWAENKESGAIVAWRLRKVAQELGGGRRTLYLCGCPGAAPTVNARTVSPTEVLLCPRFWRLGQPGFLPAGQDPRWIRAGTILHEMLHQLFGEFFRHFRVRRIDGPTEAEGTMPTATKRCAVGRWSHLLSQTSTDAKQDLRDKVAATRVWKKRSPG